MSQVQDDMGVAYEALRCELLDVLTEHCAQGRFSWLIDATDDARSLFLIDLTHSVAEILVGSYAQKDPSAYAAALADARTIASGVVGRGKKDDRGLARQQSRPSC